MQTISLNEFTKMFFDKAFPNSKKSGAYFDEWLKRFLGDNPERQMTDENKRIYWKLIDKLGEKSPLQKPKTVTEYNTNLNQCFKNIKQIDEDFLQDKGYHIIIPDIEKVLKKEVIKKVKYYLKEIEDYATLIEIGSDFECVWKKKNEKQLGYSYRRLTGVGRIQELVEFFCLTMEELK